MTEPIRDDAEIYRLFDYARNHPENWDQATFMRETSCGTAYCIAGFKRFVFDGVKMDPWDDDAVNTGAYATKALGLNPAEEGALFYDAGTHEEVEAAVKDILNDFYR